MITKHLALLLLVSLALGQKKKGSSKVATNTKAASPYQNCGCQCSNLSFKQYGKSHGNCLSPDETGALWCYVDDAYSSTCQDATPSKRGYSNPAFLNKKWSYEACDTPPAHLCGSTGGLVSAGGGNGGSNAGFSSGSGGSGSYGSGSSSYGGSNSGFGGISGGSGSYGSGSSGFSGSSGGFASSSGGSSNYNGGSQGYGSGGSVYDDRFTGNSGGSFVSGSSGHSSGSSGFG